jgi:ABC-type polysaccharide/polyol phosphate transport system ATPase subunit
MERIIVDKISKKFRIGFKKKQSTLARIISLFSGKEPKKILIALNEVSFKAKSGEIIGIIGKNGSGKSTLLRTIAGIYSKDNGIIKTKGNIISLIGLSIGLEDRLTMKENIFLVGSLFGLSRKNIKKRFDSIVKFAELKDFLNTKLYQFSEGMKQRLAFSIAIHSNPEILLLDEVFAVGDKDFRIKSAKKIKALVKKGAIAILVSHELWMIEKYCDRVIWIDKGEIVIKGNTKDVLNKYLKK